MKPAEERRSKRFRNHDELELRIALFVAGAFLLSAVCLVLSAGIQLTYWFTIGLLLALTALSGVSLWAALFGSNKALNTIADAAGSHELLVVFLLIAIPIAWIARRFKEK